MIIMDKIKLIMKLGLIQQKEILLINTILAMFKQNFTKQKADFLNNK